MMLSYNTISAPPGQNGSTKNSIVIGGSTKNCTVIGQLIGDEVLCSALS